MERDTYLGRAARPVLVREHADPDVDIRDVLMAFAEVLKRAEMYERHAVQREPLSVRERMVAVLERVNATSEFVPFAKLFTPEEGRRGVVVAFLALMELLREALIEFVQNEQFGPIYVRGQARNV